MNKHKDVLRAGKIFDGRRGAARIISIVPLCADGDAADAARRLNGSLDISVNVPASGILTVGIDRFKQKVQYVIPPRQDFLTVLDACKVADFVIFILSAKEEVDSHGESLLRAIESQGVSNVVTVVQYLDTVEPAKRRPDVKKSLLSFITHFFPTTEKVHSLDTVQEAQNVIRSLCTQNPRGIRWRDARSYLLAEEVRWDEKEGSVVVAGTVRGKGLKADRLVHIPGHGDYQIEKICAWSHDEKPTTSSDAMAIDTDAPGTGSEVLEVPSAAQDDLAELAPEEEAMRDAEMDDHMSTTTSVHTSNPQSVLLDDHYYFEEKEDERFTRPRRLPKGTSNYQAAWILDSDFEESDMEDADEDGDVGMKCEGNDDEEDDVRPEDGEEGMAGESKSMYAPTEFGDDTKSEMFLDPSPEQEAEQIKAFRNRQKDAAEDFEFPDEIELPPNVLARERLARYRGLKSLRSSKWETAPDVPHQPAIWNRLAQIQNYAATKTKVLNEALVGGVPAGTRVLLYIRNAPRELVDQRTNVVAVYSLLRHEHKKAMVHFSVMPTISGTINPNSDEEEENSNSLTTNPVKSKDPLIIQFGPRRMLINPLFSTSSAPTKNDVYKFEKFLHPARTSVATFIAPLIFGSVPVLYFRPPPANSQNPTLHLLATGTSLPPTPRIIAKRVVLTGHPYKIHKRLVTVRFMFFNKEDVNYFRPVQLYTKRGRSGYIKESLGTHGWFKATFDGGIGAMDAVAMSLYKRVWPREAVEFKI